jgi:TPP-dependent pyruvate/acetoin dehydrogenase alpha subunit
VQIHLPSPSVLSRYEENFRRALRIRLVEERLIQLYPSDKVQSPVHLSIGQEAVAVGVCEWLRRTDLLFTTYRGHAYYLAKGGDLNEFFAELYGRRTGFAGGKAGSMHLAAPDFGMMGASAVVASTIPHGVGAALVAKRRGSDHIIVCVFGDGAADTGVYHESLNFAALHRLPVLFVCENNGLAVHLSQRERQAFDLVQHALSYGIPAMRIKEGYDFIRIGDAVGEEIAAIRAGEGPRYIEVETFRYQEHVGPGDDFAVGYRSLAAFTEWRSRDPLVLDTRLVDRLRDAIDREIEAAVTFAETSPLPAPEALLRDVL